MSDAAKPIWTWTATAIAEAVRRREITATDALDSALDRIAEVEPRIRAFCTPMVDQAREAAAAVEGKLQRGEPVGALAGVPVAVKDLIATKGRAPPRARSPTRTSSRTRTTSSSSGSGRPTR